MLLIRWQQNQIGTHSQWQETFLSCFSFFGHNLDWLPSFRQGCNYPCENFYQLNKLKKKMSSFRAWKHIENISFNECSHDSSHDYGVSLVELVRIHSRIFLMRFHSYKSSNFFRRMLTFIETFSWVSFQKVEFVSRDTIQGVLWLCMIVKVRRPTLFSSENLIIFLFSIHSLTFFTITHVQHNNC